jgi:uncharacterized protein YcnI
MCTAIAGLTALAVLALPVAASAQVTVSPAEAEQGGPARITLRVTNDNPAAPIVKVEVLLPEDAPIAEVYPMSLDNWAPSITTRNVERPLESLHGNPTVQITSAVAWTAADGKALPPGAAVDLSLSAGPMPRVDRLVIRVVQTHADGTVVRWTGAPTASGPVSSPPAPGGGELPALVVTLKGEPAEAPVEEAEPAAASAGKSTGKSGGWLLLALVGVAAVTIFGLYRQRRERSG